jgi:mannose-1-phosphate guanylyltransferase
MPTINKAPYAVIMAGGSGTRFWPASRAVKPKQFLNLFGGESMLQATIRRIAPLVPADKIYVVTNVAFMDLVKEQCPEIPANQIIGEPVAKNTAPCVAIGAALIEKRDTGAPIIVLPSDHVITNEAAFLSVLKTAVDFSNAEDALVTIGITPNRPETGYGYIQRKQVASSFSDSVFPVARFAEKPDLATAERFLASGDFLWNSGMFVWRSNVVLNEFSAHLPAVYSLLNAASTSFNSKQETDAIASFFHASESVSVDYGIMEKSKSVFVVPGDFGWNDVGSWTAVHELAQKNELGNASTTPTVLIDDSKNCYISSSSGKLIALVGLENIAIVETDDAILITDLTKAQQVKNITNALKGPFETFR